MKKSLFLVAAAAALFAACTNDDTTPRISKDMATSYAKVSISMPSTGTRAGWGDNFDAGSADEAAVNASKIWLVLYDDNGTVVGTGAPLADQEFKLKEDPRGTDNISDTGNVVFKLDLNEGAPVPTQVAAFVNLDAAPATFNLTAANFKGTDNIVETYEGVNFNDKKTFVMTSAGYYSGSNYICTANIAEGTLYTTASGAENGSLAADIYVERLAAKVKVNYDEDTCNQDEQKYIVKTPAGQTLTPTFNVTSWGATGTAKDMYLLKKPFTYSADNTSWMNGQGNYRSYWAEGTYWDYKYSHASEDSFLTDEMVNKQELNYLSYADAKTATGTEEYVLEHTYNYEAIMTEPFFNASVASTSAIVIGNYTFDNATYNDGFYLLYTGAEGGKSVFTIYSESELVDYIVGENTLYEDAEGNTEAKTADMKIAKAGKGQFELEGTYYTKDAEGNVTAFEKKTNARWYSKSEGYFFVPIEHYTVGAKDANGTVVKNGYYGVVRNHSYILDITAISGLAAPMDDWSDDENKEEPIIPDPEDLKEAYIKATINVLSWHVVNQNVEL